MAKKPVAKAAKPTQAGPESAIAIIDAEPVTETKLGRPRMFQDAEAVETVIAAYISERAAANKPPTVAGLCRALECTRQTLLNYEDYHDAGPIVDAIKRARARCEEGAVDLLMTAKSGVHPAGPIFILKNCHGYKDLQEVAHSGMVGIALGVQATDEQRRALLPAMPATLSPAVSTVIHSVTDDK